MTAETATKAGIQTEEEVSLPQFLSHQLEHVHPFLREIFPFPDLPVGTTGGRVGLFQKNWAILSKDPEIRRIVSGWEIPFIEIPIQTSPPPNLFHSPQEKKQIATEIESMLKKGAIQRAPLGERDQVISNIFTRPKKEGKFRTIINLKKINHHIPFVHFQMDRLMDLRSLLKKGDLMVKVDLSDAYWSIPIHKNSRKFMRFMWEGQLYEFLVLAFGLGPAPRLFTKLMKIPITILRKLQIRIIVYLDDFLLIGSCLQEILTARDSLIFLLEQLGYSINRVKSILTPCLSLEFLGMIVDSLNMTISLPEDKIENLVAMCQSLQTAETLSLRELSKVIGKLYATAPAVSEAPLQTRALQQILIHALRDHKSYESPVCLDKEALLEIEWWIINLSTSKNRPIHLEPPQAVLTTDSSTSAWGAHLVGG